MKVLVATRETQGQRTNDFCFCEEGELVGLPHFECDGETVDGRCGCRRSMVGMRSNVSTTTFKVIDRPGSITTLQFDILDWMRRGGWPIDVGLIADDARELARVAANFDVGTVLERRGEKVAPRVRPS